VPKHGREVFEQIKAMEAAKEGVQAIAPGLSLNKIFSDIKAELKQQAAQGAHELASALFRGDPFVLYPRQNQADGPAPPQQEQSRGGREL
jgi:hypothetical protein